MTGGAASFLICFLSTAGGLTAAQQTPTTNPPTSSGQPQPDIVGWTTDDGGRGTLSLVVSCVATLTLCVWSALHLNVPPAGASLGRRAADKAKWVLLGIFAPELVVATAASQRIAAQWLRKQIEKDAKFRTTGPGAKTLRDKDAATPAVADETATTPTTATAAAVAASPAHKPRSTHTWDLTQCFYAVMGGLVVNLPWLDDEAGGPGHPGPTRVSLTVEGVRLLSFLGRLPTVHREQIEDKSKADWMAKSIVCLQAAWMMLQVVGRLAGGLPVSLLEINTCGHVVCAFVLYVLWWSKPLDVQDPTFVEDDEEMREALALLYLCSDVSATQGITDIRCFVYQPASQPCDDHRVDGDTGARTTADAVSSPNRAQSFGQENSRVRWTTHLSIGSPGSRDPRRFLGFTELLPDSDESDTGGNMPSMNGHPAKNRFAYYLPRDRRNIAPECEAYFRAPYTALALRHSAVYCRRHFPDARHLASRPLVSPALLALASAAAARLWDACASRPEYRPFYYTWVPAMGTFLGETEYLVRSAVALSPRHVVALPDRFFGGSGEPGRSSSSPPPSQSHVDVRRDALRAMLALTAAAYGGLHCAAWADYFPSGVERTLWIVAALTIAASGGLTWAVFAARQLREVLAARNGAGAGQRPGSVVRWWGRRSGGGGGGMVRARKGARRLGWWLRRAKMGVLYPVLAAFVLARIFIVVEAFVSLRRAPAALYDTPNWVDVFPHF